MPQMTCANCGGTIEFALSKHHTAANCPHCGDLVKLRDSSIEAQVASLRQQSAKPVKPKAEISPGAAAILSLFIPGLGQMCKGQLGTGILFLVCTLIGYAFIIPGLILHLWCVVNAARS